MSQEVHILEDLAVPLPEPTKPDSIRCVFGIHKTRYFELDGSPVGDFMLIGNEYFERCLRCGKTWRGIFYMDRS